MKKYKSTQLKEAADERRRILDENEKHEYDRHLFKCERMRVWTDILQILEKEQDKQIKLTIKKIKKIRYPINISIKLKARKMCKVKSCKHIVGDKLCDVERTKNRITKELNNGGYGVPIYQAVIKRHVFSQTRVVDYYNIHYTIKKKSVFA